MVGSMRPGKNHIEAVEALVGLAHAPWELDIVGRDDEFPDIRARVVASVAEGGVADRVRLHGARTDVEAFYARAHLVLQPSLYEGFPNVLLEAWAWRCAVMVSDRGDLPRIVTHGRDGLVVPIGHPGALRAALRDAIGEPARLAALGESGNATLRATYTFDAVADRWWALLAGAR
jgi:glycosyltransferase involved in cell wall biosynthesis